MAFYHYQRAWQIAKDGNDKPLEKEAFRHLLRLAVSFPDLAVKHLMKIIKER